MAIAAMWGKSVGYTESEYSVMIETTDGRVANVSKDSFNYLYFKLDDFTAALKEDCIEYVINDAERDLFSYPEWYVDAVADGLIWESCDHGVDMFYDERGEIAMSQESIILRNFMGNIRYMERNDFDKYYDALGE